MAFVEKVEKGGRDYYFVSASHRLPGGGWKKLRRYFGSVSPSEEEVDAAGRELGEEARRLGVTSPDEWVVVEEFPEKPPGRARPLTVLAIMERMGVNDLIIGVPGLKRVAISSRNGQADMILAARPLARASNLIFKKVLNEPEWAEAVNRLVVDASSSAFNYFGSFPQDFSSFEDSELSEIFQEATRVRIDCHETGISWVPLDMVENPPLSAYLMEYISKRAKGLSAGSIFSILTTPLVYSNAQCEEAALVDLAIKVQVDEEVLNCLPSRGFLMRNFLMHSRMPTPGCTACSATMLKSSSGFLLCTKGRLGVTRFLRKRCRRCYATGRGWVR